MRTVLIVANWKMHKTLDEAQAFVEAFLPHIEAIEGVEMALAPAFTVLRDVGVALKNSPVRLAAQNLHFAAQGAYTGEISPLMLRDVGCSYVIVGHSERRQYFHEDDALINKKLAAAFEQKLIAILCVGETLQERHAGATERVLERQVRADLRELDRQTLSQLVMAYEPIWAIGTGETASPADAEQGARFLRELIRDRYGSQVAQSIRILYGGSVKPENVEELISQPNIDGALVGGASLDPQQFAQIIKAAARAAHS